MAYMTLEQELVADLSAELESDKMFSQQLLISKVRSAIREVKRARKYPSNYTEEQIERDIYDYYINIRNVALFDYNQIGGEFQESNSEPGSTRTYMDRNKLFSGIVPISRF